MARPVHFNSFLISKCRLSGVSRGQHADHDLGDCPFGSWLAQEQLHRPAIPLFKSPAHNFYLESMHIYRRGLLSPFFGLDACLSILVDQPPSVRYQDICIPLSKLLNLWTAASEDERRNLQWNEHASRENATRRFLVRKALDLDRRRHISYTSPW